MKPFNKRFQLGDIICSDRFYSGECMIVQFPPEICILRDVYVYHCVDLIRNNQYWSAYEFSHHTGISYNWRIATDDDIVKYLDKFINITRKVSDNTIVEVRSDGLLLKQGTDLIVLNPDRAIRLLDVINQYIAKK